MNTRHISKDEALAIDSLMPGNQIHGVGQRMKSALDVLGTIGKIIYLDPTNGNDNNDGLSVESAVKTLAVGYALLRDGRNDVLYYIAGSSSISLSAGFTWAKSYTHFIGICSPVCVALRARIFQAAAATGVSPLFNVTGSGCVFANLYWFQGVDDATSLVNVQVTGQRNLFHNCHFAGIGHATMDAAGACSLKINGGAENRFVGCYIGLDTIARGADTTELLFDGAATRNVFEKCQIYAYVSNAGHALVTIADAQGIDRFLKFVDCDFISDSENAGVALTSVFDIPAIVQGKIILRNCIAANDGAATDWDSNNRGILFNHQVAAAASAAGGICSKQ